LADLKPVSQVDYSSASFWPPAILHTWLAWNGDN